MSQSCYISPNVTGYPVINGYSCPSGFYCPASVEGMPQSVPQVCIPDSNCTALRLISVPCPAQGLYEPIICPPGFYCPTDKQMIECPVDHWCPTGTTQPKPCGWMTSCPERSEFRVYFGGLFLCLIFDLLLMATFCGVKYRHRWLRVTCKRDEESVKQAPDVSKVAPQSMIIEESAAVGNGFDADPQLLAGYLKAFQVTEQDFRSKMAIDLEFQDLKLVLPDGRQILGDISGHIRPSRLTCIMGPSGSGKTTCMNVLMGKLGKSSGKLWLNGVEHDIPSIKSVVGYVPQDDTMLREMTVRETIRYSAATRLPPDWSSDDIDQFVDAIINTLGLLHVQHSLIGDEITRGISGGQRKRVNIGMELASAPLMLFCDEPTSGLDSTAALKVISTLKSIANLGVSVIAVLHQPRFEIFEKIDEIILIGLGGRITYFGSGRDIQQYFEGLGYVFDPRTNPADTLMDILSSTKSKDVKLNPTELCNIWQNHLTASSSSTPAVEKDSRGKRGIDPSSLARKPTPFWYQTWLAHNRSLIQQYRKFKSLVIEVGVASIAGLLIGISVNGELFRGFYIDPLTMISPAPLVWPAPLIGLLIGMAIGLAGAPAGVKLFSEERVMYWREAASGHNQFSYYFGKTWSVLYRILLTSLHFAAIFCYLAKPQISFDKMYAIVFLMFYCVYGLSSIVSMFIRREDAPLLAVVATLFAAVFCGFGPTITDAKRWGLLWLWEMSYAKHATEAFFSEEALPFSHVYNITQSTKRYGFTISQTSTGYFYMFLIGSVMRAFSFALMVALNRSKRR